MEDNKPEPQKYDPNKVYGWEEDTLFTFTGKDFGVLLNDIKRAHLLVERAVVIAEQILTKQVEAGTVKERPYEESKQPKEA